MQLSAGICTLSPRGVGSKSSCTSNLDDKLRAEGLSSHEILKTVIEEKSCAGTHFLDAADSDTERDNDSGGEADADDEQW
jgi:hypothetical protein